MKDPERRQASRLIVIDSSGRILLFRHRRRSGGTFWASPGDGLEPGETFEQAAMREASDELGLTSPSMTFLWENTTEFIYIDRPVHQQERFFRVNGDLSNLLTSVEESPSAGRHNRK